LIKFVNDSVCKHFALSSNPEKHKFSVTAKFPYRGPRFRKHILSSTLENLPIVATEQFSTWLRKLSPNYGNRRG